MQLLNWSFSQNQWKTQKKYKLHLKKKWMNSRKNALQRQQLGRLLLVKSVWAKPTLLRERLFVGLAGNSLQCTMLRSSWPGFLDSSRAYAYISSPLLVGLRTRRINFLGPRSARQDPSGWALAAGWTRVWLAGWFVGIGMKDRLLTVLSARGP